MAVQGHSIRHKHGRGGHVPVRQWITLISPSHLTSGSFGFHTHGGLGRPAGAFPRHTGTELQARLPRLERVRAHHIAIKGALHDGARGRQTRNFTGKLARETVNQGCAREPSQPLKATSLSQFQRQEERTKQPQANVAEPN